MYGASFSTSRRPGDEGRCPRRAAAQVGRAAGARLAGRALRRRPGRRPRRSAVVVFGSVARGDFNLWSDIDVLVVVAQADDDTVDRVRSAGRDVGLIAPVVWTPAQLRAQLRRRDPIAIESTERGVWLVGGSSTLRQQLVDGLRATITVQPGRDG